MTRSPPNTVQSAELGGLRGDELPAIVATARGRRGWLRAAAQRLDEQRAQQARPIARDREPRLRHCRERLEQELAAERHANALYEDYRARGRMKDGRRFGSPSKPYTPPLTPQGKINTTDPDSKLVHGMRGWVQGYNAQAACNERHLILAAEIMTASPDFGHLAPLVTAARRELSAAGVTAQPQVILADAGYWHLEQMTAITADGIPVLVPPDSSRRAQARPGWTGGAYDFMSNVLATDHGATLYKQRGQLIESIFGHTKHNRGFTRFHRRGRSAARTEWRLMAATHNLRKLHQHFNTAIE